LKLKDWDKIRFGDASGYKRKNLALFSLQENFFKAANTKYYFP